MRKYSVLVALEDILAAMGRISLVRTLGWQDVRHRYKRSALGPFWLSISMGVMIGTIGMVFGQIFKSPMTEFLPFLAIGMIFWGFMSSVINEGCTSFIASEGIIKQLPLPLFVHIMRMVWRNILILAHNIMIFPFVLLVVGKQLNWTALISIPGFLLVIVNLAWIALILATICARYRDLPQIVGSVMQVLFYLTPIMWMPSLMPDRAAIFIVELNPVYHLFEVIRAPLMGYLPKVTNWKVCFLMAVVGWIIALAFYGRYKRRIAYWI